MPDKKRLIDRVVRIARAAVPERRRAIAAAFVRAWLAGAPAEDLQVRGPRNLAGAALSHLGLAEQWTRTPRALRVFNPAPESDGWNSRHTIVQLVTRNTPFLVDSLMMEFNRLGFVCHLVIHPMLVLKRTTQGRLTGVESAAAGTDDSELTSFIHAEIDRETDADRLQELETGLHNVLSDVRAAVSDWKQMLRRVHDAIGELESTPPPLPAPLIDESAEFLRWLTRDHFILLGCRDYELLGARGAWSLRVVPGSGLGILRERPGARQSRAFDKLPPQIKRQAAEKTLVTITKSNSRSTIHRPVYLDYIGIRRYGAHGRVTGERRLLGLFTSRAHLSPPRSIPLVRRKIEWAITHSGLLPNSHAGKLLLNVLDTCPRNELLQAAAGDLLETGLGIVELQERHRVRIFIRRDPFERFCTCLVFVPRERFHSGIRLRIQGILLRALNGTQAEFETHISQSVYAQLYLTVHTTPGAIPAFDTAALEREIAGATRTWTDDLHVELQRTYGEEWGNDLMNRYRDAFPAAYQEERSPVDAAADVRRFETALAAGELQAVLYRDAGAPADHVNLRLYNPETRVQLSAVLPLLENLGLFVISQSPYEIEIPDGRRTWVHDFGMRQAHGRPVDPAAGADHFQEAFTGIWRGTFESDSFNQLVLAAGLRAREIALLRAWSRYMRQIGTTFSERYVEDTVNRYPEIARLLIELFCARFDPRLEDRRMTLVRRLCRRIEKRLDGVQLLDEDRILRRFYELILAMLRTNWFQSAGAPKPHVAFKFAPRRIPGLDPPQPRLEIFVYSPRVEGVHLRGGRIARGGLRWSDRREDFRTEVLGLMKAQTVKNAVIVPVGAKGGFYVKSPPSSGRAALVAEGIECYRTFIRGLLDLTDNRGADGIVTPSDMVRYDDDDPYLVVAADKGTATFSDIANGISAEYGFWLGDAFASGGSAGYDHKAMGITARGAWESVRHHFQRLGVDPDAKPFTVVGIGDMSGDVFGNGMLLSRQIRLVGAFNHQHVFLDPDPDPDRSHAERRRLFELPGSTWADYDRSLISRGGGIFPRSAKSIALDTEARRLLETQQEAVSPTELIRLLLQAGVDLLWNGGIGTWVKADDEPHAAAGDRGNDALRVNSSQLRCRMIAEGGNLGLTQRARVQYAQAGGLINADWIDNSGGVHCSDREVNLKILLNGIVSAGRLSVAQRNALLKRMTGDVASMVLQDNYRQARAITAAEYESRKRPGWYGELLRDLDRIEDFSREREQLPDAAVLDKRRPLELGLVRPEIAAILAHTKLSLKNEIIASDLPDDPHTQGMLERYFPAVLQRRFPEAIRSHELRREIIATQLANSLVNRAGIPFAHRLADETGAPIAEIARAFLTARDVFDIRRLWDDIDHMDYRVPLEGQMQLVFETQHLLRHATRWFLRHPQYLRDVGGTVERYAAGVTALEDFGGDLIDVNNWGFARQVMDVLRAAGIPSRAARRFAGLRVVILALEATRVAQLSARPPEIVVPALLLLGQRLEFASGHAFANRLRTDNAWQDRARTEVAQELVSLQGDLTVDALSCSASAGDPARIVEEWTGRRAEPLRRYQEVLNDLRHAEPVELAMLNVMTTKLRDLKSRTAG